MLRRAILLACGVSALASAAFVCVVALSFSLYAALKQALGPAWASAGVAGACLLLILFGAVLLLAMTRGPVRKIPVAETSWTARALELAKDRPIVAAGAILAFGVAIWSNPKIATAIIAALQTRAKSK